MFLLRLSFVVALVATFGSLFFSEVLGYPPCLLCWYQRIAMYPLAVIFFVALWADDDGHVKYALPLAVIGLGIAIYHNLLYYGILPDSIKPCQQGVSCTSRQVEWLGFITIPLLSLVSFTILTVTLTLSRISTFKRRIAG
jgi:disulfide bond formation protein DsbB